MAKNTINKEHKDNSEAMLKGRMAETIVEELLRSSGNKVYRFGYEAIVQNLTQLEQTFDGNTVVGQKIRAIPDFIVVNKTGIPEFAEVKFRWNGEPAKDDHERFEKISKFWNAPIILINCSQKPYLQVLLPPYFDAKGNFKAIPLESVKGWNIDKEMYSHAEELVVKYLGSTMLHRDKLLGKEFKM